MVRDQDLVQGTDLAQHLLVLELVLDLVQGLGLAHDLVQVLDLDQVQD